MQRAPSTFPSTSPSTRVPIAIHRVALETIVDVDTAFATLAPEEQRQLSVRAKATRRREFVGGRLAARAAAHTFLGTRDVVVVKREAAPRLHAPELFVCTATGLVPIDDATVSISHAEAMAVAAVGAMPLGIDLVVAGSVQADVHPMVFHANELNAWREAMRTIDDVTGNLAADVAFAAKECALKMLGEGLQIPPLDVTVGLWRRPHALAEGEAWDLGELEVRQRDLKPGHFAPMHLDVNGRSQAPKGVRGLLRRHDRLLEVLLWADL